ncbi:MAG TPA: NADP-dependent oxidoreductase [Micromonosporaceae bacterium]
MVALRAHTRGGPEQLVVEAAPVPQPGQGEALVAVHAAAITFTELGWDQTWTTRDGTDRTPVIPSHEFAGMVADLGPDVHGVRVGDPVYGLIDFDRDGAAATYTTVPADQLAHMPRSVSYVDAAALPLAALTAWQALVDHAELQAGETLLVHGGAGGVGVYGVQLGRILGATVIATGRSEDGPFVRDLGASRFIDVSTEAFDQAIDNVDVVFDTVGGSTLDRSYGVLRPGGRLVSVVTPPSPELATAHGVTAMHFIVRPDRDELDRLAGFVDAGQLVPVVARTFPLTDGRSAYESAGLPRSPGKTVIVVDAAA